MGWSVGQEVEFASGGLSIRGHLARPAQPGRFPAVLVFHGRNGPSEAFLRGIDRLGDEGFVALSVHWQTHEADPADEVLMRMLADAAEYLRLQDFVDGSRVGIAGFCRGGGIAILGLGHHPFLRTGVSFHGTGVYPELTERHPRHPVDMAEQLTAPLLILHGMSDPVAPVDSMYGLARRLNEQGKSVQFVTYSGVRHAFTLPGGGDYDPVAAADAWEEAVRFLRRTLG